MKLLALVNISSSIGVIQKGMAFHEMDPYRVQDLLVTGAAKAYQEKPVGARTKIALDWTGGTAVIICSGPSLSVDQCEAVERWQQLADGRYVIVVNTSFRRAPFADVLYACDGRWWKARQHGVSYFEEAHRFFRSDQMWTQEVDVAKTLNIQHIKSIKGEGLSKTADAITQGENSGYQAIGLAVLAGVKKIVLLGMDMHGGHWHGDHPAGIRATLPFRAWLRNFIQLAADLKRVGVEVINCTPGSALKVFPYVELKEVLCLPSVTSALTPSIVVKPSSMVSGAQGTP